MPTCNLLRELKDLCHVEVDIVAGQVESIPDAVRPGLSDVLAKSVPVAAEEVLKLCHERDLQPKDVKESGELLGSREDHKKGVAVMDYRCDPTLLAEVRKYGKFDVAGCFNCGSCVLSCDLAGDHASFPTEIDPTRVDGSETSPEPRSGPLDLSRLRRLLYRLPPTDRAAEVHDDAATLSGFRLRLDRDCSQDQQFQGLAYRGPGVRGGSGVGAHRPLSCVCGENAFYGFYLNLHGPGAHVSLDDLFYPGVDPLPLLDPDDQCLSHVPASPSTERKSSRHPFPSGLSKPRHLCFTSSLTKRWRNARPRKGRWLKHIFLASGCLAMLVLLVFWVRWFQTDKIYPVYHPQRWIGYVAAAFLIFGTVDILVGRLKKEKEIHKTSDFLDWTFPILLLATTVSGIVVHILRISGLELATHYSYAIH